MFECEITVKGGSNSPSKDSQPVTGPVDSFFRNYSKCYTAVKNHVLQCPECCPEEALRRLLATRDKPSLKGFTSTGLVRMALQIEKGCEGNFIPGKRVSKWAVNEFIYRTGRPEDLVRHASRLDSEETVKALQWIWRQWKDDQEKSWKKGRPVMELFRLDRHDTSGRAAYWLVRTVAAEFDAHRPFPPLDDLERLATVAEVMFS